MIPQHIADELKKMTAAQKQKFHELCMWASAGAYEGCSVPIDYHLILDEIKRMGPEPITPIEPDKTVNHDWETIKPKIVKE
jgi:hypothetical protein